MSSIFIKQTMAVAKKEFVCEVRNLHQLASLALFALTGVFAAAFVLQETGARAEVAAPIVWVLLFFTSASGLSRSFVREEESGTSYILRLTCAANAVYLGKLAFNIAVLCITAAVTVPLYILFTQAPVAAPVGLAFAILAGTLALGSAVTITGAMIAKSDARSPLHAVISFPIVAPVLVSGVRATSVAMDVTGGEAAGDIRLLIYYAVIINTAALMLFRYIWEE